MREGDLAVLILEDEAVRALKDAGRASAITSGMLDEGFAAAARFDADEFYRCVSDEGMEDADGFRAPADTGDHGVGETAFRLEDLAAGLSADHLMEVAHHHRVGVRSEGGAEQVIGVVDVGDPI